MIYSALNGLFPCAGKVRVNLHVWVVLALTPLVRYRLLTFEEFLDVEDRKLIVARGTYVRPKAIDALGWCFVLTKPPDIYLSAGGIL